MNSDNNVTAQAPKVLQPLKLTEGFIVDQIVNTDLNNPGSTHVLLEFLLRERPYFTESALMLEALSIGDIMFFLYTPDIREKIQRHYLPPDISEKELEWSITVHTHNSVQEGCRLNRITIRVGKMEHFY